MPGPSSGVTPGPQSSAEPGPQWDLAVYAQPLPLRGQPLAGSASLATTPPPAVMPLSMTQVPTPAQVVNQPAARVAANDLGEDLTQTKRDMEIDAKRKGEFTIDSAYVKSGRGRRQHNLKCEVKHFERGTDIGIKDSIDQIETYFQIGQVSSETFVPFLMIKIAPQHFN